ncbi:substrate-binding and VWA domain-containing protein [Natronoglycomyces albus]|uniref:VWA domain-containing protein n=1 Tax=Natronoglycomyces albus TaxID=2811108 RepID=A0A895XT54_9ACTN|nr:substrate-binding and VWA domain-containing protein [Natronoglycomyces albus]QSB06832.1 VWA domain-containing protein [Natronoglycomyces albus]
MVFGHGRGVKSHRLGRRRKGSEWKLPVAPWIIITIVVVLVLSTLTTVYATLLRSGCSGSTYDVRIAASGNVSTVLTQLGRQWESSQPDYEGRCVGVDVEQVSAPTAAEALSSEWDETSLGERPVVWVPDSVAWLQWAGGSQAVTDMVSDDPQVLAGSPAVIAAPDVVVDALGWNADDPLIEPSWEAVFAAAEDGWSGLGQDDWGDFRVGVANPRSSTAGLHALLTMAVDDDGEVQPEAVENFNALAQEGRLEANVDSLWREVGSLESLEQARDYASVYTALEHEVVAFNRMNSADFTMESVPLEGTRAHAQFPYLLLAGAGWTSDQDIAIAEMFGEYLASSEAQAVFEEAGFRLPTETDEEAVEAAYDGDTDAGAIVTDEAAVASVLQQWQALRRSLNVLVVVDSSVTMGTETVEVDGEFVSAHEAAKRQVAALADGLGSSSQMGLWDFAGNIDGDGQHWREGVSLGTVDASQSESLVTTVNGFVTQQGGSSLFSATVAGYEYLQSHYDEGAANVVVVVTNGGTDPVSAPTLDQTADTLATLSADRSNPVRLITVGLGDADQSALELLASSTQGSYVNAPDPHELLGQLRSELFN